MLADPHIASNPDHDERLADAVDWLNASREDRSIEAVVVVGDIGWGDGLARSRQLLDDLAMPYLPVLGDNEVVVETGGPFDAIFGDHIEGLADVGDAFRRAPVEVHNPVYDQPTWMQNYGLRLNGLTLLALDWVSRDPRSPYNELAELHDFTDGTWPFFEAELGGLSPGSGEDVLLFSHHPMHLPSFDLDEMARITALTGPLEGRIAGNWAGHYHVDFTETVEDAGYDVFVTDATWDDENTIRVVECWSDGEQWTFEQELVVLEQGN